MKPVYFPFTYISKPVADALRICFRQTIVYQPARFAVPESMQEWAKSGMLELRFPVGGRDEQLAVVLKNYKDWAKLHTHRHGLQHAFVRTLHETIPFFNETSVSHIKADIKSDKMRNQDFIGTDPVFNARLFLAFAQEFDLENERLHRDFTSIKTMENNLFTNLHGLSGDEPRSARDLADTVTGSGDMVQYMISERFKAWYQLLQSDPKLTDNSRLFITTSRSALTHLLDAADRAQKIASLNAIPGYNLTPADLDAWRRHLADQLQQLIQGAESIKTADVAAPPSEGTFNKMVSLNFYIFAAETPLGVFSRFADPQRPSGDAETRYGQTKHTLIGYLAVGQKNTRKLDSPS